MRNKNVPDRGQVVLSRGRAVAAFVRERRKANHMTQADLGDLAGVGRRLIVEIEKGKPTLRMDAVNAVLSVFGKALGVVNASRPDVQE